MFKCGSPCTEKVLPPTTEVEIFPKVQGPVSLTSDWYSFRHNLKKVLHSREQVPLSSLTSPTLQQDPLLNSPLEFWIPRIWSSKEPVAPTHDEKYKQQAAVTRNTFMFDFVLCDTIFDRYWISIGGHWKIMIRWKVDCLHSGPSVHRGPAKLTFFNLWSVAQAMDLVRLWSSWATRVLS